MSKELNDFQSSKNCNYCQYKLKLSEFICEVFTYETIQNYSENKEQEKFIWRRITNDKTKMALGLRDYLTDFRVLFLLAPYEKSQIIWK